MSSTEELIKALKCEIACNYETCPIGENDCSGACPYFGETTYSTRSLLLNAMKALESLQAENKSLRNELCLKCGQYSLAHNGACDGCRWRTQDD